MLLGYFNLKIGLIGSKSKDLNQLGTKRRKGNLPLRPLQFFEF